MAFIAFNLFRGLYFLVTNKGDKHSLVRSLAWRIGLSMALFLLLVIFKITGLVEPHALNDFADRETIEEAQEEKEGKTIEEIQAQPSDGRIRLKDH
jgi:hypothetical protein